MIGQRLWVRASLALVILTSTGAAQAQSEGKSGLAGSTILLVRHAEKPADGPGLTVAGENRAEAYASYFSPVPAGFFGSFWSDQSPLSIDTLVATADTAKSARPRLTLEPTRRALHLPIQQPCADKDVKCLRDWLASRSPGHVDLIAWHHGTMPKVLEELGADPNTLLPGGTWPGDVYDWVIELRYNAASQLVSSRRVQEPTFLAPRR